MTILLFGTLFFLGTALLLYALFGGADFGAGVLEIFLGKKKRLAQQEVISQAIAPVWEANHIWLIIVIVILFMGFPQVYSTMSIYLHIPLVALLIGIVGRGCAFTFRHYDTLSHEYYKIYSWIFSWSSIWAAFFLGNIAGSLILGKINPTSMDYFDLYIFPWFNSFSFAVGFFAVALFGFLAAVYLVGESREKSLQELFIKKAKLFSILMVVCGAAVFFFAERNDFSLWQKFSSNKISMTAFAMATVLWFPFWKFLKTSKNSIYERAFGVAIVTFVFLGWFAVQFPVLVNIDPASPVKSLDIYNSAAPEATMRVLFLALVFGVMLIFPALGYLIKVFKGPTAFKH